MTRALLRLARGVVVFAALGCATTPALAEDDDGARLLAAPEKAPDPERLRRAAEEALERDAKDRKALRALLVAVTRLRDRDLLDDALERAKPAAETGVRDDLRLAYGTALLRRARLDDPPERTQLEAAERALTRAEASGTMAEALELAHARHLLGNVDGALRAYARVLDDTTTSGPDEELADRALDGIRNLGSGADAERRMRKWISDSQALRKPPSAARLRAQALLAEKAGDAKAALEVLNAPGTARAVVPGSPRTLVLRARLLRAAGQPLEASRDERAALEAAGTVAAGGGFVLHAVERLWQTRPLGSFEDCAALERDYDDLIRRAAGFPDSQIAWLNNLAFRLREVVSTYTWRGEGRTQGIAEGAPKQVASLLARCVALYDGAVSLVPKGAADASFESRWFYAGVLNDAGLMRHYFLDVRDLARAEALYLRAFELTDGAYMDTYFYNLQYLYGFELPGREETWFRLAQRAQTKILAESKEGGFVPDERKRDAARRDAEGLRRKVEERGK